MLALRSLFLFVLPLAVSVMGQDTTTTTTTTTAITPELCFQRFGALEFRFDKYDRYTEFFRNDSDFISIPAGIYTGPKTIEEYTRFGSPTNPMMGLANGNNQPGFRGIVNGTCEILLLTNSWYEFVPPYARGGKLNATLMSLIVYDPIENYIKRFILHIPEGWMDGVFAQSLGTDRTRQFICETMRDSCPDVWQANQEVFSEVSSTTTMGTPGDNDDRDLIPCKTLLRDLPSLTDPYYSDANSQGCRALHSVYASQNSDHCAHISFLPMEDPKGKIKCQETAGLSVLDYFTQDDLDKFDAFVKENSFRVDYPSGARIYDVENMTEAEIEGTYGGGSSSLDDEDPEETDVPPDEDLEETDDSSAAVMFGMLGSCVLAFMVSVLL